MVPLRLFKTTEADMIDQIIRYTNSQNAVEASDFRSTDSVQRRLKTEFQSIPGASYEGGRRGNISDAIKRRPNLLPRYTVGQALMAFHGGPTLAYNEKSRIWSDNAAYNVIFNGETTAQHIVFCFSLLRAVERRKNALTSRSRREEALTVAEQAELSFFRLKGAQFFVQFAIGQCIELFIGKAVPNKFKLTLRNNNANSEAWGPILDVVFAFSETLIEFVREGQKSDERAKAGASTLRQLLQATASSNQTTYQEFAQNIDIVA
jgi:hypothetical protein